MERKHSSFVQTFWQFFISKVASATNVVWGALIAFFTPLWSLWGGAILLILIDLWFGRRAAKVRGDKITSAGYWQTVYKCIDAILLILAAHGFDMLILSHLPSMPDWVPVLKFSVVMAGIVAVAELKSIDENLIEIQGWGITGLIQKRFGFFYNFISFKNKQAKQ